MNEGYVKLTRSETTLELLRDLNAFGLLTLIALRAKRTGAFSVHGLTIGQALIGDHESHGLTRKEYRCAKARLKRYGLADFEPIHKGTIATLLDNPIYDINEEDAGRSGGKQGANEGPTEDYRAAPNKNEKNEKNERTPAPSAEAERLAELLLDLLRGRKADFRRPNLNRWARDIDRLIRLDERRCDRIEAVLRWCQSDPFWQNNILSAAALRKHFDRLELQMQQRPSAESIDEIMTRLEAEGQIG